jgi:hypothetical protein
LGISDRKATVTQFLVGWNQVYTAPGPVTVPQISYFTNDSWEEISCLAGVTGYPLLHSAQYASGRLYVLTIPDNFADLYHLPVEVLNRIKETVTQDLWARVEAPSQVALFLYDNDTLIVESFLDQAVPVRVVVDGRINRIEDGLTQEALGPGEALLDWRGKPTGKKGFPLTLKPHSFRVFHAASPD